MKLTCEGCQAKYAIADEKIAGRNFKIRCKRCGAALVVRGEGVIAAPLAAERAGAEWYVLDGDRQDGPFDVAQLREKLASGTIDGDTYAWRDGLSDWQPLAEMPELAAPSREADLFDAANAPSPFAPSSDSGASLTGSRNESSVLFSLSNLKALSTAAPVSTPAPAAAESCAASPAAKADGSGLIDIRALAAAARSAAPASTHAVDDLLSLGSSAPSLASPLGPPVIIAASPARGNRSALVALVGAAGAIALAAAVIVVVLVTQGQTAARADTPHAETAHEPIEPRVEAPPVAGPRAEAPRAEAIDPVDPAPLAETAATEAPAIAAAPTPRETARAPRRSPRAPAQQEAPVARAPQPERPAQRDLNQLIDDTINDRAPRARERAAEDLPATPTRSDVLGAMNRVAGPVRSCGNGARGPAPVRFVFSGDTGRVSSAEVIGTSLAPQVRSCIARAARNTNVPRFGQSTFRVDYPFAL